MSAPSPPPPAVGPELDAALALALWWLHHPTIGGDLWQAPAPPGCRSPLESRPPGWSTSWAAAGPLMDRFGLAAGPHRDGGWWAEVPDMGHGEGRGATGPEAIARAVLMLIAHHTEAIITATMARMERDEFWRKPE